MSPKQPTKNTVKTVWHTFINSSAWRWLKKLILFTLFSLVVNHLASPESFPDGKSYRFPIEGFLSTILFCILIGIIAELNFKYYKKKYFSKKIEIVSIWIANYIIIEFYSLRFSICPRHIQFI